MDNNFISSHNDNNTEDNLKDSNKTPSNTIYHNFILNKKNLDGKLLVQNYQIKSHFAPINKFQHHKRRILFDRRSKFGSSSKVMSQQKQLNNQLRNFQNKPSSSQGNRQNKLQDKLTVKHIKTTQDTFLFRKSIDLKQPIFVVQSPQNFQKILQVKRTSNPSRLIHLSFQNEDEDCQNTKQCQVQRCNLLAKYLHQTSNVRSKQDSIIKRNSISKSIRTKRYSSQYSSKPIWKKTLQQFLPKISIDKFVNEQKQQVHQDKHLRRTSEGNYLGSQTQDFRTHPQEINFCECSAKNFSVLLNNKLYYQKKGDAQRQIASLTKIMTLITSLFLIEQFQLSFLQSVQVKVSREAVNLGGTTANLKFGDVLMLKDLLFGMMLPSGNDAAFAISEYFGRLLYKKSPQYEQKMHQLIKSQKAQNKNGGHININNTDFFNNHSPKQYSQTDQKKMAYISSIQAVEYFIREMNCLAKHLEMKRTWFVNCHGLSDYRNKSTSNDIAKLVYHCMRQNQKFREIVGTKYYESKIFNKNSKMIRIQRWMNSNLLLWDEDGYCLGVKTGNTPNAGPCLASYFSQNCAQGKNNQITIVLLGCMSKQDRFKQVGFICSKIRQKKQIWKQVHLNNSLINSKFNKNSSCNNIILRADVEIKLENEENINLSASRKMQSSSLNNIQEFNHYKNYLEYEDGDE